MLQAAFLFGIIYAFFGVALSWLLLWITKQVKPAYRRNTIILVLAGIIAGLAVILYSLTCTSYFCGLTIVFSPFITGFFWLIAIVYALVARLMLKHKRN